MVSPLPLLRLMHGFTLTKTLAAAVELDLFGRIAKADGLTRQEAARELGIADRPADLLLAACAALGLLDKTGDTYVNSPLADAYLVPGRPHYFGGLIRFMDGRQYPAWHNLTTALREDRPVAWDPSVDSGPFEMEDPQVVPLFWETMFALSTFTGRDLAGALPMLAGQTRLLDVGGGWGAMAIELCRRWPNLRATVYDLAPVCETTRQRVDEAGFGERIATAAGDFFADDELPGGHDVIVLSSILHDWDEKQNRSLLRKCFRALEPGGMVVVSEFFLDEERTGPPEAALMGLTMLVETPGGKNYATGEYTAWLLDAGFERAESIPFEAVGSNGALIARKP